ncbi:MAG: aminomethyl-transferring glycine dehydrogenase subunit GcvPA [Bacillota bacterium]|nr:aminomethyl-transferring glycine dehydrogenase subunit GcvPA [Bacillota bacterium]
MSFSPHTAEDREAMLRFLGLETVDDLFAEIPPSLRLKRLLDLPEPLTEEELRREMKALAAQNADADRYAIFMGGGIYDRYIPAALPALLSRGEFLTAYTPYQPEASQGTLRWTYEFQTMILELTGMEVANASMYDGASAAAEAALMALSLQKAPRDEILMADTVHPQVRETVGTYLAAQGFKVRTVETREGALTPADLKESLEERGTSWAAVFLSYPNYFGIVEDLKGLIETIHDHGALAVVVADPVALALLTPPGELGADLVVGEGQGLGLPMAFGGPGFGFLTARMDHIRRMPGRIAGRTVDLEGREGFVLTLQTREQHIRRARATSNITTNHALMALGATIYMTLLGPQGLKEVAEASLGNAHLALKLLEEAGARRTFAGPFFQEFVVELPGPLQKTWDLAVRRRILPGIPLRKDYPALSRHLLVAVTEKRTREEMEALARAVKEAMS